MGMQVIDRSVAISIDNGGATFFCAPFNGEHHPDRKRAVEMSALQAYNEAELEGVDLIVDYMDDHRVVAYQFNLDKYKYSLKAKEKANRKKNKPKKVKTVKMTTGIAENDLDIKIGQVRKFLGSGNPVQIVFWIKERNPFGGKSTEELKEMFRSEFSGHTIKDNDPKTLRIEP